MSDQTRKIAVLTGDLVNSTGLGPEKVERAFMALEDCAEMQAEWMGGQSLHFTRHRGDGWQVALAEPKYALRSALCFRAALRALGEEFDSYIGITQGEVEGEIGTDLNEQTDKVFAKSGLMLDSTKGSKTEKIGYLHSGTMVAATILLDYLSSQWSPTQAETVLLFIERERTKPITQSEAGKILGKSRQSVAKSLEASHFRIISDALLNIEVDTNA
ncbi:hypothetical protein CEW89_01560 [Celeribacter ethanolicus]|uniref:Uncharacterized protein n=1 Tax=Celeribacter ethanolicus TaxID=1758178 RepID=A0A291G898_9RHOB|nr:hypothetical protein [Celeribacter ethanolicus]ATG46368.1 hypothetical protein CEW89_01560 [Celeribacter ethanolicus]